MVFLSDYDVLMAEHLVQGVDVWVNTPRRPWEASGTSGMKVLVNGGLNLSELDGWWAEAYSPEVGWAIGDGREHGDDPSWDAADAESLYAVLEKEVIPEFYARDEHGIPRGWVARMRESMARLTPTFFGQSRSPPIYRRTLSLGGSSFSPSAPRIEVQWEPISSPGRPNWRSIGQRCDSAPRPSSNRASNIYFTFRFFLMISIPMP